MTVGVPGRFDQPDRYTGAQVSLTPIVREPRAPLTTDRNYPLNQFWENVNKSATLPDAYGDLWYLAYFQSNGNFPADAIWIKCASAVNPPAGGVISLSDTADTKTFPDGTGNIQLNSLSPGLTIVSDPSNNKIDFTLGGGGPFIDQILVDAATAPGVNPVTPDVNGQITVTGIQVASGSAGTQGVQSHTTAVNQYQLRVQQSTIAAALNTQLNGLSHFNQSHFFNNSGFVSQIGFMPQTVVNMGLDYTNPTFTIQAANGSALSATNNALVILQSNLDPGETIIYRITANLAFNPATAMTGNTFGTTAGVAWANEMPMFLYAVASTDDTLCTFMLSRVPHRNFSPVAGNIAKVGSAVATTEGSFFAIDSTITVANYATSCCHCIGSVTMTKSAGDAWTMGALAINRGIGQYLDTEFFEMPLDQNGAVRSGMSSSVGGNTIPTWNDAGISYKIQRDGNCMVAWNCNLHAISGVGAGTIRVHKPFPAAFTGAVGRGDPGIWSFFDASDLDYDTGIIRYEDTNIRYVELLPGGANVALLTPAYFDDKDLGSIQFYYGISKM